MIREAAEKLAPCLPQRPATRWADGEEVILGLLEGRQLERLLGVTTGGEPWLIRARETAAVSRKFTKTGSNAAFSFAYRAARQAVWALMAQQRLRVIDGDYPVAASEAVDAQFGDPLTGFRVLFYRQCLLEYGTRSGMPPDPVTVSEAEDAAGDASVIIEAAGKLLPELGIF
jgi:hypothetical protein